MKGIGVVIRQIICEFGQNYFMLWPVRQIYITGE